MIRVRVSQQGIPQSDIEYARDTRISAMLDGRVVGSVAIRMIPLVHEMEIEMGPLQRRIADALFNYALGYARASGIREGLFLVEDKNCPMQHWLEEHGAVKEKPGDIWMLEVS